MVTLCVVLHYLLWGNEAHRQIVGRSQCKVDCWLEPCGHITSCKGCKCNLAVEDGWTNGQIICFHIRLPRLTPDSDSWLSWLLTDLTWPDTHWPIAAPITQTHYPLVLLRILESFVYKAYIQHATHHSPIALRLRMLWVSLDVSPSLINQWSSCQVVSLVCQLNLSLNWRLFIQIIDICHETKNVFHLPMTHGTWLPGWLKACGSHVLLLRYQHVCPKMGNQSMRMYWQLDLTLSKEELLVRTTSELHFMK